jgi:hypothetical protein
VRRDLPRDVCGVHPWCETIVSRYPSALTHLRVQQCIQLRRRCDPWARLTTLLRASTPLWSLRGSDHFACCHLCVRSPNASFVRCTSSTSGGRACSTKPSSACEAERGKTLTWSGLSDPSTYSSMLLCSQTAIAFVTVSTISPRFAAFTICAATMFCLRMLTSLFFKKARPCSSFDFAR